MRGRASTPGRIGLSCLVLLAAGACSREDVPAPAAEAPAAAATEPTTEVAAVAVPKVVLTDSDDGRAVRLQRDEVIEVRLPADRASGFTWIPAEHLLPVMRTDGMPRYVPVEPAAPDGPGIESWRFVALEPGHAHLVFDYVQPLGGVAPVRTVTFHFDVE